MSFSNAQIRKLQRDVKACDVRTRDVNGKELSYIEGWHAIAEANRIFGFDGWSRETVEHRCLVSRENRGNFHALYIAKIKITVRTESAVIIREGFGTGEAQAPTAGEAHDKAIKTAETDATKRAFATFGKPFGLSLYLGNRKRPAPNIQRRRTLQRLGPNGRYHPVPRPPQNLLDTKTPTSQPNGHHPSGVTAGRDGVKGSTETKTDDRPGEPVGASVATAVDKCGMGSTETHTVEVSALRSTGAPGLGDPVLQTAVPAPPDVAGAALLLINHPKRRRDPEHLHYVCSQPCLICSRTPSDAHHLKFAQPKAMAKKVSDEFTVPLCRAHHRQLHHAGNEIAWWLDIDIDPLPIARDLWEQSRAKKARA